MTTPELRAEEGGIVPAAEAETIIAAFEPFGGRRKNRSWEAVRRLQLTNGQHRCRLPVDFVLLHESLEQIAARGPRALLLVGEAPGRRLRVEAVGLNLLDAERPDNAGRTPRGQALLPDAPLALPARWNAGDVARRLESAGIPAVPSYHAGTFACNAALYLSLCLLPKGCPVGFLHVPRHGWPRGPWLRTVIRGVEEAAAALTEWSNRYA